MHLDPKTHECLRLMNKVVRLATTDDKAPIRTMEPIDIITSALDMVLDDSGQLSDSETIMSSLAGVLSWVAYHHWDSVSAAIRGRPNSRVTSRHFSQGKASRVLMSSSNRPYGLTCSQISGVSAA